MYSCPKAQLMCKSDYITFSYQDEIYLNLVLEYIPETVYKVHTSITS